MTVKLINTSRVDSLPAIKTVIQATLKPSFPILVSFLLSTHLSSPGFFSEMSWRASASTTSTPPRVPCWHLLRQGHLGKDSGRGCILAFLRFHGTWANICCVCPPNFVYSPACVEVAALAASELTQISVKDYIHERGGEKSFPAWEWGSCSAFAFTPPCVSLAADDWGHIPPKILFLLDVAVGAQTVMFWKFFFFFFKVCSHCRNWITNSISRCRCRNFSCA